MPKPLPCARLLHFRLLSSACTCKNDPQLEPYRSKLRVSPFKTDLARFSHLAGGFATCHARQLFPEKFACIKKIITKQAYMLGKLFEIAVVAICDGFHAIVSSLICLL